MSDDAKTCFIAMPVTTTPEQAERYGDASHWTHVMETLFVPAIEAAGFEALRPVSTGSDYIQAEIVRQLESADMVLCDMSHNNANVFFELGVRTSVNKPVALVRCDRSVPIPFDVSSINTHTYNPGLKAWHIDAEVASLAEHLRRAEEGCAGENPMWRHFGLVLKATQPTSEGTKEEALLGVLNEQIQDLATHLARSTGEKTAVRAPVGYERPDSSAINDFLRIAELHARNCDVILTSASHDPTNNHFLVNIAAKSDQTDQAFRRKMRNFAKQTGSAIEVIS